MKLWLKFLLGIVLGVISFFILPNDSETLNTVLSFLTEFFTRFGRYALLPLMFFSVSIAVFKLRDEGLTVISSFWIITVIVLSSLLLTIIGEVSALVVKMPPIPISMERSSDDVVLSVKDLILSVFPYNGFDTIKEGVFLLPCFVFAGFFGGACTGDKIESRQVVLLLDSVSKVCYAMMSFFSEILAIGMVAFSFRWCIDFSSVILSGVLTPLIIMLTVNLLLIAFVIYPLILRFLCHDPHPYKVLYASICPFLAGFFSGDTNLVLGLAMRHGKESLGIRRRTNAVAMPLLSIFGRGGAALVVSVSFIIILRSYSYIDIKIDDILQIGLMSFLLSFALGGHSVSGPFIALTILCTMYGKGFASGYLLLKSASPIICAYAAGIDALTTMFGSYIIAVKTKNIEHKKIKQYI